MSAGTGTTMSHAEFAALITQQTVYLMGISFMLGSLFTIFILLILDMMRAARENSEALNLPPELDDSRDAA